MKNTRRREVGNGTVFKRNDKWIVRVTTGFTIDGKQIIKQLGSYKTKSEASKCLNDYNKVKDIRYIERPFKDIINQVIEDHKDIVSEITFKNNYIEPAKKLQSIEDVSIIDLDYRMIATLLKNIPFYIRLKTKYFLSKCFKEIQKNEPMIINYAELVESVKPIDKEKGNIGSDYKVIPDEIVQKLWLQQDNKYVDIALILLYSGMRIQELLDIEVKNIHLDKNYMIGGLKTDAGRNRIIPIHKYIQPIIEKYIDEQNTYLFQNNRKGGNGKYNYMAVYKNFNGYIKEITGKQIKIHDTRHTFATNLSKKKVDLFTIKRILGHAISDVTQGVYIHQDANELIEAVNKVEY